MIHSEFAAFLEDMSQSMMADDFQLWRSRLRMPLCLALPSGSRIIRSESEACNLFLGCVAALGIQGVDRIIRRPVELGVCEDGIVLASFETQLLSRGTRAHGPFESSVLLHPARRGLVASSMLNCLELSIESHTRLQIAANCNSPARRNLELPN